MFDRLVVLSHRHHRGDIQQPIASFFFLLVFLWWWIRLSRSTRSAEGSRGGRCRGSLFRHSALTCRTQPWLGHRLSHRHTAPHHLPLLTRAHTHKAAHYPHTPAARPPTPIPPHHVTFDTFSYYVLFLTHASLIPGIGKCSRVVPWIGHVETKKPQVARLIRFLRQLLNPLTIKLT